MTLLGNTLWFACWTFTTLISLFHILPLRSMESPLHGKVALVTGSSDGIGKGIALRLAREGAFVIVNSRTESKCQETVTEIQKQGGKARYVTADISKLDEIKKLFDLVIQENHQLDIFVNCAGVAIFNPIVQTTEKEFDTVFDTNTKGAFFALQAAAQRINPNGRIIAISSGGIRANMPSASFYLASKLAVEAFVRGLAVELADKKVTVNCVSPGWTETRMIPEAMHEYGKTLSLFKRMAQPEVKALWKMKLTEQDIANVVNFLAGSESGWVTGQNIFATGGWTMNY